MIVIDVAQFIWSLQVERLTVGFPFLEVIHDAMNTAQIATLTQLGLQGHVRVKYKMEQPFYLYENFILQLISANVADVTVSLILLII